MFPGHENYEHFGEHELEEIIQPILQQVDVGNFSKREVEEFTEKLNLRIRGEFKRIQGEVNFEFDQIAMKRLMIYWYEKEAYKLTKEEAINRLITALEKSDKPRIAFLLKQKFCVSPAT